jgi:hypothetical protein
MQQNMPSSSGITVPQAKSIMHSLKILLQFAEKTTLAQYDWSHHARSPCSFLPWYDNPIKGKFKNCWASRKAS